MAAISNVRVQWPSRPETEPAPAFPVDSIPCAAALVDGEGVVLSANGEWLAVPPNGRAASSALEWCAAELRDAVLFAIHNVADGIEKRFTKEYTAADAHCRRLSVTAAPPCALIVDIDLTAADDQSRRQRAEKMETVGRLGGGVAH